MSFSSQNPDRRPGGDSPPEIVPPRAPNPNPEPPVLYSFFPLSPDNMEPTSPTPVTVNPTPSSPPTFAPSQTVNESLLLNDPTIHSRPLHSQEASPASRRGLKALARQMGEARRAEAARISHPGPQICNPPAQIARQTPKSSSTSGNQNNAKKITKRVPSMVGKATSSKTTASDLFSVAKALGGEMLLDLVWAMYAYYVSMDKTEGRQEPSDQSGSSGAV